MNNKAIRSVHLTVHLIAVLLLYTVIIPGAYAGDFFKGKTTYVTYCQACHGSDGRGALAGTPNFKRGQVLMKPDAQLFKTIMNGSKIMPGFRGVLKNEDIDNVISYIRSFH